MPIPQSSDEINSYFDAAASFLAAAADDDAGRNLERRHLTATIGQGYALLAQTAVLALRNQND